jgi:hypothetical protein
VGWPTEGALGLAWWIAARSTPGRAHATSAAPRAPKRRRIGIGQVRVPEENDRVKSVAGRFRAIARNLPVSEHLESEADRVEKSVPSNCSEQIREPQADPGGTTVPIADGIGLDRPGAL